MDLKNIVRRLRTFRVWHRSISVVVAFFLLISAVTGILLGLKKDIPLLQPPTQKVNFEENAQWLSISTIEEKAIIALNEKVTAQQGNPIDRIDFRPSKGVAKVIFENSNWEVQLNAITGETLSVAKRYSDWIESLHDGSIVNDLFKVISMNLLGFSVILMAITGLWLYFGPKRFRKLKKKRKKID